MPAADLETRVAKIEKSISAFGDELRLALRYIQPDAASSLTKSRMVLEKLLIAVYKSEMGHEPRKPLLGEMLADNQFTRKIERRMLARMNAVRDMGNLGPHGENVKPEDATRALDDLCEVLDWYLQRYAGVPLPERNNAATMSNGPVEEMAPPAKKKRWSWTLRFSLTLTVSLGLLLAIGLDRPPNVERPPQSGDLELSGNEPGALIVTRDRPLNGSIDIKVWRTRPNGSIARLRLSDADELPLKTGDQFRIEAEATRPAYLYLFWIDTEGKAVPVYPWDAGKWGTRPADEQPVKSIELPRTADKGYTISGDQPGMETLILIARVERLALGDEQIQSWFAGLPPQRPFQNPESAVWFENGKIVTDDSKRPKRGFDESAIADPVLRVQGLLKDRIGPQAEWTVAVSFARLGKDGAP